MSALTPLLAPDDGDNGDYAHHRADARSNMFATAVLYCDRASSPVRVRNLSPGGALIECTAIPPEQSAVQLSRGSLSVTGQIVWRRDNRAGVKFDSIVAVADWLPGGSRPSGQQRVDEIVHSCRTMSPDQLEALATGSSAPPSMSDVARQLTEIKHSLDAIAEEMAGDMAVAASHPTPLQVLDVSVQKLAKLAAFLSGRG